MMRSADSLFRFTRSEDELDQMNDVCALTPRFLASFATASSLLLPFSNSNANSESTSPGVFASLIKGSFAVYITEMEALQFSASRRALLIALLGVLELMIRSAFPPS